MLASDDHDRSDHLGAAVSDPPQRRAMSKLLLLCSILLLRWAAGAKFWGASFHGGESKYPQSLLDDVDDFDYVREREEIMAREALTSSPNPPQSAGKNVSAGARAADTADQGYAEDDRTDDEEIFFQGTSRNHDEE